MTDEEIEEHRKRPPSRRFTRFDLRVAVWCTLACGAGAVLLMLWGCGAGLAEW